MWIALMNLKISWNQKPLITRQCSSFMINEESGRKIDGISLMCLVWCKYSFLKSSTKQRLNEGSTFYCYETFRFNKSLKFDSSI